MWLISSLFLIEEKINLAFLYLPSLLKKLHYHLRTFKENENDKFVCSLVESNQSNKNIIIPTMASLKDKFKSKIKQKN